MSSFKEKRQNPLSVTFNPPSSANQFFSKIPEKTNEPYLRHLKREYLRYNKRDHRVLEISKEGMDAQG